MSFFFERHERRGGFRLYIRRVRGLSEVIGANRDSSPHELRRRLRPLGFSVPRLHRARSSRRWKTRFVRAGRATRRGVSRTEALMWRLMAYGSSPGAPRGVLTAWPQWEHLWRHLWPLDDIPGAPYGTLKVRFITYRGSPIRLADGTRISSGDRVGELHCNNSAVLRIVRDNKMSPYSAAREDMRCLAQWAAESVQGSEVRAYCGITILGRAAERLGFATHECSPGIKRRLDRMFMVGLLLLYTTEGLSRLNKGRTLGSYPQQVWMTRRELLRRYGAPSKQPQRGSVGASSHVREAPPPSKP